MFSKLKSELVASEENNIIPSKKDCFFLRRLKIEKMARSLKFFQHPRTRFSLGAQGRKRPAKALRRGEKIMSLQ